MNALANSQYGELEKYLLRGFPANQAPVRFATYTGQEGKDRKDQIIASPPDILLTNYVMLELILTRPEEDNLIAAAKGLKFLVLDELHTYRGRQGSDVAMLVRRVRDRLEADHLQCVGTSATLASEGTFDEQAPGSPMWRPICSARKSCNRMCSAKPFVAPRRIATSAIPGSSLTSDSASRQARARHRLITRGLSPTHSQSGLNPPSGFAPRMKPPDSSAPILAASPARTVPAPSFRS